MSVDEKVGKAESGLGNLGECLVGGSPEEQARRRKVKRRAIAISVVLQSVGLTALVIAPLLAKPAELTVRNITPIPPYSHAPAQRHTAERPPANRPPVNRCVFCAPTTIPPTIVTVDRTPPGDEPVGPWVPIGPGGSDDKGMLPRVFDQRTTVVPPPPPDKKRLVVGHIDPALLTRRVEPVYPALPKQLHRSGRVELRAVIATDGTIQSLEVVSGDPWFLQSALDAVRQWRYKPTYLNGQPVEIDTYITVIYTLQQ